MLNIFKSKVARIIQIAEKINELTKELEKRKEELNIINSNDFNHYDNITVFAEIECKNVDRYKECFTIQGVFAKKIIKKLLEDEIKNIKTKISTLEREL